VGSEKLVAEVGDTAGTRGRLRQPFEAATNQRLLKIEKTLYVL
jgi:hypothetical protein